MSEPCALCGGPVNPYDVSTWKEVSSWVGGPKKDSARGRKDTGRYAHTHCIIDTFVEHKASDQLPLDADEKTTPPTESELPI